MVDSQSKAQKYKFFTIGAIGTFMATLDSSILNVALPTIADEFSVPIDLIAWVVLSYSLTLVSLLMVFGAWSSRKGYKFAYKFGYMFFTIGSIICVFSQLFSILLIGRIIQAIGGAMFQAVGPGMVTEVFPENERGKGMGLMVMAVGLGLLSGPALGGLLLSYWSWQSIFIINIPIGFFGLFLTFRYFKNYIQKLKESKIPIIGSVSVSLVLLSSMLVATLLGDYEFTDPIIIGLLAITLISLIVFLKYESDPEHALIGLDIFKNKQFTSSVIAMFTLFVAISGIMILIPFYLERIKHLEPKTVGLFLMILPVTMIFIAPISGKLSDKIGYRFLTSFGFLMLITGLFLVYQINETTTLEYLLLSLMVIGIGVGIFNTPNSSALMGSVNPIYRPIASGIMATTRNIGISFGIAISTGLFAYFETKYLLEFDSINSFILSYHNIIFISILVAVFGLPFCLIRGNR